MEVRCTVVDKYGMRCNWTLVGEGVVFDPIRAVVYVSVLQKVIDHMAEHISSVNQHWHPTGIL